MHQILHRGIKIQLNPSSLGKKIRFKKSDKIVDTVTLTFSTKFVFFRAHLAIPLRSVKISGHV